LRIVKLKEKVGTLIISPHSDDIAFSIGGALLSHFFPEPLMMVTVFTRSISADYFDGPHDEKTITAQRESEDRAYAGRIGSGMVRLGLPEATLIRKTAKDLVPLNFLAYLLWGWGAVPPHPAPSGRGRQLVRRLAAYVPVVERSVFLHKVAEIDCIHSILMKEILSLLDEYPNATLVSPLGLGTHPNHIAVAEVCRSLAPVASKTFFFEDLSYASAYNERQTRRFVRIFDDRLRPVPIRVDQVLGAKIENSLVYTSQVKPKDMEKVSAYARGLSLGVVSWERVWTYADGKQKGNSGSAAHVN
jgi:LmbE family N-acetylglucosaminyl deacetylase